MTAEPRKIETHTIYDGITAECEWFSCGIVGKGERAYDAARTHAEATGHPVNVTTEKRDRIYVSTALLSKRQTEDL